MKLLIYGTQAKVKMPPVDLFLIRGLAREAAHWGPFVGFLKKQKFVKSVTCLELPGTGQYRRLTAPLTIGENAEFIISQFQDEPERPRILVSVSLGAMVSVEIAQRRPDLFSKMFLMNTSFSNLSPFYHRLQLFAMKQFLKIGLSKNLDERESQVLKMVSHKAPMELAKEWADISRQRPMPPKNFFRQLIAAGTYRIAKEAPLTEILVMNSLGDKMVHPSCSERLSKHWGLPLFTHPSAGHDIAIDSPQWIVEIVESHLGEV